MASPVFRVTLITLIAAGIGGGLLYTLQAQPARIRPAADPTNSPEPHRALHSQYRAAPDDGYAELFQGMGPIAFTSNPRPAPPNAAPAPATEDDFSIPLPLAREALASVGIDDLSEAIWELAINDPALAPEDRKNLIEDLNEDGFADSEHPAQAELPLIEARLALISRLAPEAMDQVNADAFAEAKKDLEQMRVRLTQPNADGQPQPSPSSPHAS